MTERRVLARNAAWNLSSQLVPALVAIVAVRLLIHGLGDDRFGVLGLAWTLIGYFSLFDLGLGRALTQAVSVAIGDGDADRLESIGATALGLLFGLGTLGGVALAAFAPLLANHLLQIPDALRDEALRSLRLLALALPFVVATSGLRGLLEAHQDFAVATALRVPFAIFSYVGPVVVLPWSHSLVAVIGIIVVGRVLLWVAHLIVCLRRYAYLRRARLGRPKEIGTLMATGGWMTVSNIVSPLMVSADRFLIGALLSMAAVSFYVTPYEAVYKILIVPSAILGVFFPAFAAAQGRAPGRATKLFDGSLRVIVCLVFPAVLIVVGFSPEILRVWVGPEYAANSAIVMRWLAIGVFVNSAAQVAFSALQAMGRADLTARLHLIELPLYAVAIVVVAKPLGIVGVAMVWTARVALDAVILFWLTSRRIEDGRTIVRRGGLAITGLTIVLAAIGLPASVSTRAALTAAAAIVFIAIAWTHALLDAERGMILRGLGLERNVETPAG